MLASMLLIALLPLMASAQTETNKPSGSGIWGGVTEIYNAAKDGGLLDATNYAFEPYATYAPKNSTHGALIGGGALIAYDVNDYVGVGLGIDYLGQLSLVSANLTLKLPTHPLSSFVSSGWLHDLTFTPFVLGGTGKPLSGTSTGGVTVIQDAGAFIEVGHLWGGRFNVGACYGSWSNAGKYSGDRYHAFLGWSKGF
jgi:hypothetical protein